tara:strand:+ start:856 stop:3426 length:2571 start_codon:yes stop_codon:yes gene_type:complete
MPIRDFIEILENWPQRNISLTLANNSLETRLLNILKEFKVDENKKSIYQNDFLKLFRQYLIKQSYEKSIVIENGLFFSSSTWIQNGFECTSNKNKLYVRYKIKKFEWLQNNLKKNQDEFDDAIKSEDPVNYLENQSLPLDPFIEKFTNYNFYKSPGQRNALNSSLLMKEGDTIIVNLPTGTGKSIIPQAITLMNIKNNNLGIVLVVVPTIALALDQERRIKELLNDNDKKYAWYSGLNDDDKNNIKNKIKNGQQPILFISPESILGTMLPILFDINKRGLIRYIIIDEAHLVCEWGSGFREEYQNLVFLIHSLLSEVKSNKFRTVLMSATFTKETINNLEKLFYKEKINHVSEVFLRKEPKYLAYKTLDISEKKNKILELIDWVPRPFILYTNVPFEANSYFNYVKQRYNRVECFTGKTDNKRRIKIIEDWNNNNLDGIIATSAFGVGIDNENVRTVIHANVPETLDRFYQEVGRGGRDGKSSYSILIYTQDEINELRQENEKPDLSTQKAWQRWKEMMRTKEDISSNNQIKYKININSVPSNLNQISSFNRKWNLYVLNFMAKNKIIKIIYEKPNLENMEIFNMSENEKEKFWDIYYNNLQIEIKETNFNNELTFKKNYASMISKNIRDKQKSLNLLEDIITGAERAEDALAKIYQDNERNIIVEKACRGCLKEKSPSRSKINTPFSETISNTIEHNLHKSLEGEDMMVLYYSSSSNLSNHELTKICTLLISNFGVREIIADNAFFLNKELIDKLLNSAQNNDLNQLNFILFREDVNNFKNDNFYYGSKIMIPSLIYLSPWGSDPIPSNILKLKRKFKFIIAPDNIKSEFKDHLLRTQSVLGNETVNEFFNRNIQ